MLENARVSFVALASAYIYGILHMRGHLGGYIIITFRTTWKNLPHDRSA